MERIANVTKIAVIRASALGDLLMIFPALEAVHQAYPDAEIVLLSNELAHDLLRDRPSPVHRVVIMPPIPGVRADMGSAVETDEAGRFSFRKKMQAEKFDVVLQMHGNGKNSNPFALSLAPRVSAGFHSRDSIKLDRSITFQRIAPEIMKFFAVTRLIGVEPLSSEPRIVVTASDVDEARTVIRLDEPFIVLHPGGSKKRRYWPAEKFAELGDHLVQSGLRVVVTGTRSERNVAQQVVDHMTAPAVNVAGALRLQGLIGLLSLADLYVGNDTGPLHLATALGTSAVGIYWGMNAYSYAAYSSRLTGVISWNPYCPECGRNLTDLLSSDHSGCDHNGSLVADVSVAEVLAAIG